MSFSTTCPHCDAHQTALDTALGKKVKCKECGDPFVARRLRDDKGDAPGRKPVRSSRRRDRSAEDERSKRSGPPVVLFVLLGVGALIMVGGGVAAAVYFLGSDKKPAVTTQGAGPKGSGPADGSLDDRVAAMATRVGGQAVRGKDGKVHDLMIATGQVTDADLADVDRLTALQTIDVSDNPRVTDTGLAHLHAVRTLTKVMASRTGITDAGLVHLAGMPELMQIYCGARGVHDAGLAHVAGLAKLQYLGLGQSGVTDAGMDAVGRMLDLKLLVLDDTAVTDAGLTKLYSLNKLKTIRLINCAVTEGGVIALQAAIPRAEISR
jgi:hypothetical protein